MTKRAPALSGCKGAPAITSSTPIDRERLLALALAVGKPGPTAMLIGDANDPVRTRISIEQAIDIALRDGFAPVITPDDDVIPIDGDNPSRQAVLDVWVARARELGVKPVVIASGRPGHQHVWARVEDAGLRARLTSVGRDLGLSMRIGQGMRPPLAPHKQGLPVYLIDPSDPEEALRWLSPTAPPPVITEKPSRRRETPTLPPATERLLVEGDVDLRYPHDDGGSDRSAVFMAISCSAAACQYDKETLFLRARDPRNAGGACLQCDRAGVEISETRARKNFDSTWKRAKAFVERHGHVTHSPTIHPEVEGIRALAYETITGRTADTDLIVLDAVLDRALKLNRFEIGYAILPLAEDTRLDAGTVRAALRRLRAPGWLVRLTEGRDGMASTYRVGVPEVCLKSTKRGTSGCCEITSWWNLRLAGLFRSSIAGTKALGKAAGKLLSTLLDAGEPMSMREIIEAGLSRASAYRGLKRLKIQGLVVEDEDGRLLVPANVKELMAQAQKDLRLDAAENTKRRRHKAQRDRYHEKLEQWREDPYERVRRLEQELRDERQEEFVRVGDRWKLVTLPPKSSRATTDASVPTHLSDRGDGSRVHHVRTTSPVS